MSRRLAIVTLAAGLLAAALVAAPRLIPLPRWFRDAPPGSVVFLDRSGGRLGEARAPGAADARPVRHDEVDPLLRLATLAAEDRRFDRHPGVDPLALGRALRNAIRDGSPIEGASTITTQLVRLCRGRPRGLLERAREAAWAFVLEAHLSKDEILEAYWNRAPYGARVRSVGAASRRWFGKEPPILSPAEAALLAALPRAPSRLDPGRHPSAARQARDEVLRRMARLGWISRSDAARGQATPIVLARPEPPCAPHFLDWLLESDEDPRLATAVTTIDAGAQRAAEQALARRVAALGDREVRGGSVVVLDTPGAEILALVGSPAFDSAEAGQVNAALAPRQPGSAVKPFTYAVAFAGSLRPSTILADVPTSYDGPSGVFAPRNYAGRFMGPVPARLALANSWNVPTVEVLRGAGASEVARGFRAVGLPVRDAARLGLGLTLGAGEVRLLDLAAAYATLGRGGTWIEPTGLLETRAAGGGALPLAPRPRRAALDPIACAWVNEILSDPAARASAFGRGGPLEIEGSAAAKTGTSSDWRDAWTVIYTTRHTIAVWIGNPDGSPTREVTGAEGPAVVAREILAFLEPALDAERFAIPPGTERRAVCPLSGAATGADCPQTDWAPFRTEDPPLSPCGVHVAIRVDLSTGLLARPCTPPALVEREVFVEPAVRFALWLADRGLPTAPRAPTTCRCGAPGCAALDAPRAEEETPLTLLRPLDGTVFARDASLPSDQQALALEAIAPTGATVLWRVDGRALGATTHTHRIFWPLAAGEHRIEASVEACGARAESRITVLAADVEG